MRHSTLLTWLSLSLTSAESRQTLFGCEGETLLLSCPHSTIRVVRANYGRFSVSICNSLAVTDISTSCDTSHTTSTLLRRIKRGPWQHFSFNLSLPDRRKG